MRFDLAGMRASDYPAMIDLFETRSSARELHARLLDIKRRSTLPPIDAPEWREAAEKPAVTGWMKSIRALAEAAASEPLPTLSDELYGLFFRTGERMAFEKIYFERRRRVARAAFTVLLGDAATRERFVPDLISKMEQLMAEESWAVPAHVPNEPTGRDPFMIDLFSSETANLMAEMLALFSGLIPDDLRSRIMRRLRVQYFENYLNPDSATGWKRIATNWNAVCHQGVIGAALTVEEDLELLAAMLSEGVECMRVYLSGFGADGSTSEGPGYWAYGFGWFAELNRQLETATGGEFSLFGKNEKIRRIAQFGPALILSKGHLVNFSDGQRRGSLPAPLLAYLGARLGLPALSQQSVFQFSEDIKNGIDFQSQHSRFFYLTRLILACPAALEEAAEPERTDVFLPDYGVVVARGTDRRGNLIELAAKGGHNAEHHNHNDCGSFIINLNSQPAVVEIGAPEYVRDFFKCDETRYRFLAARSLGHSVSLVNGCEQAPGAQFASEILECDMGGGRVKFTVDLAKCYPAEARCRKLIRTFVFEKAEGRVTVADAYELEEAGVVESILMCEPPVRREGTSAVVELAEGALVIEPGAGTAISMTETCSYGNHMGARQEIARIRFAGESPAKSGVISFEIRPVTISE